MHIAICEDCKAEAMQLKNRLEQTLRDLDACIDVYLSGEEFLKALPKIQQEYEVVFSDIEMPGVDGIALGKRLKDLCPHMILIYMTNYVKYAISGYEAQAFRYLLKPVSEEQWKQTMQALQDEIAKDRRVSFPSLDGAVILHEQDILFFLVQGKDIIMYSKDDTYTGRISMKELEKQVSAATFYRIHRNYLINMQHIRLLKGSSVCMSNGSCLPVSRRRQKNFAAYFYSQLERGFHL